MKLPRTLPAQSLRWLLRLTVGAAILTPLTWLSLDAPFAAHVAPRLRPLRPFFEHLTTAADWLQGRLLTDYGLYGWLFWLLLALGLRVLLHRPAASLLLATLLTRFSAEAAANLLKLLVQRPRPGQYAQFHDSFPSSHTAIYFALLLPAAACFPRYRLPLLLLPTLVALARLVENVHHPADVLAGLALAAALSAAWLILARLLDPAWRHQNDQLPSSAEEGTPRRRRGWGG